MTILKAGESAGRSLVLAAFAPFAGPLDLLTRFRAPRAHSGAMVTLMPSVVSLQISWQDSREELGSTASAMSSMSISASDGGGNFSYQPPVT